jgi:hypothetical protein
MKTFLTIVGMVPALIQLLKGIEEAIPTTGLGAEKLAAVKAIIEATCDGATTLWPAIEKTINALVGLFNAGGVFVKSIK